MAEEGAVLVHQARGGHAAVLRVEFDANAVPGCFEGRDHGCGRATERVKDGVADERKHLHEARGQLEGEGGGMLLGGGPGEIPKLLKPAVELVFGNQVVPEIPGNFLLARLSEG